MHPRYMLQNWQSVLFGIGLFGLGIASLMYPDAMVDAEVRGRRGLIKMLIIWAWGWPLGIVGLILGAVCLWSSLLPDDE